MSVGIEKMCLYAGACALDLAALAAARGYDLANLHDNLMVRERSVAPPWEDPVTMAVNAATAALEGIDRSTISLLVVATESGVDHEKTISSWVHRYTGLPSHCRNFEIKSACYSGTAALRVALAHLASPEGHGQKALVVTTDQSFIALGEAHEYVTGAGAMAVLLSASPRMLTFEPGRSGVFAHEVTDVIRPLPWLETGSSDESLYSYMEALEGAYDAYVARVGERAFESSFDYNVYHVPFAGISLRAHRALLSREPAVDRKAIQASFERKTLPSLRYPQRVGGTYSGGVFCALLSLLDHADDLRGGERIGVYAYGSGSCAEYYDAQVVAGAQAVTRAMGTAAQLDARYPLSVAQYERLERDRVRQQRDPDFDPDRGDLADVYQRYYRGRDRLVLAGIRNHRRAYAWA